MSRQQLKFDIFNDLKTVASKKMLKTTTSNEDLNRRSRMLQKHQNGLAILNFLDYGFCRRWQWLILKKDIQSSTYHHYEITLLFFYNSIEFQREAELSHSMQNLM